MYNYINKLHKLTLFIKQIDNYSSGLGWLIGDSNSFLFVRSIIAGCTLIYTRIHYFLPLIIHSFIQSAIGLHSFIQLFIGFTKQHNYYRRFIQE